MRTDDPIVLAARVRACERPAVARAISLAENGAPQARDLMRELWADGAGATVVGITGAPGVGKSTLVSALVDHLRAEGRRIGVISVDPSSPRTRGALLGDRVRMTVHDADPGVFMRSMASRGALGGVAEATFLAIRILGAAGFDVVIVETVGVGQSEVAVQDLADSVVLVLQPASGDTIQALKAGVMEIPDVVCLNKCDLDGAGAARAELQGVLALDGDRAPALVETISRDGVGSASLWAAIVERLERLGPAGRDARRHAGLARQLRSLTVARLAGRLAAGPSDDELNAAAASGDIVAVVERLADRG